MGVTDAMNAILNINNIDVYYDKVKALNNISISVYESEIVSVIGANGAGKTTLMKSIMGLVKPTKGQITFMDKIISKCPTHKIVKSGIIYVPEGRHIFPEITAYDNLQMGAYSQQYSPKEFNSKIDEMYEIFPKLKERATQLGGSLSGGEQQMLAIARGLMGNPKLLMLDEPSLGLAPIIIDQVFEIIKEIRDMGVTVLLVEQNARKALSICNH